MRAREEIPFRGHPMVRALHRTTLEVTKEEHLTPDGDCIIGVAAGKGCAGLGEETKRALRAEGSRVKITIRVGGDSFVVTARGHPGLELAHRGDIVVRKSDFLSDRTLVVGASASAIDIPRSMVAKLRSPDTVGLMEVEVS